MLSHEKSKVIQNDCSLSKMLHVTNQHCKQFDKRFVKLLLYLYGGQAKRNGRTLCHFVTLSKSQNSPIEVTYQFFAQRVVTLSLCHFPASQVIKQRNDCIAGLK